MRFWAAIGFSAFLVLSSFSGVLAKAAPSLEGVKAWEGKYPYDEIDGRDLLAEPSFHERLEKLLGADKYKIFEEELWRGVTFPVRQEKDVFLFHFCKPHQCMDYMIYLYASPAQDSLEACWMRRSEIKGYWLTENAEPRDIGVAGCLDAPAFELYKKHRKN